MKRPFKKKFLMSDSGAAAVESIFILPFMFMLFFGSQDLISYIKFYKQMADVANVVSDTIAQAQGTITRAQISDIEKTIPLLVPAKEAAAVQVDVYDYYLNGATLTKRWYTASPTGSSCAAPKTSTYSSMIPTGSDLIVAVACRSYTPWVGKFMGGPYLLGSSVFTITQTIVTTPYANLTIPCVTTSGGNTPCAG